MNELMYSFSSKDTVDITKLGSISHHAIIRCGYRGYKAGNIVTDPKFKTFYSDLKSNGYNIGVSFFSTAINTTEVEEEANWVLSNILKSYPIDLPVFIIVNNSSTNDGRSDSIDIASRAVLANAFCDVITKAGYKAGICTPNKWFSIMIKTTIDFSDVDIWLLSDKSVDITISEEGKFVPNTLLCISNYYAYQFSTNTNINGISPLKVSIMNKIKESPVVIGETEENAVSEEVPVVEAPETVLSEEVSEVKTVEAVVEPLIIDMVEDDSNLIDEDMKIKANIEDIIYTTGTSLLLDSVQVYSSSTSNKIVTVFSGEAYIWNDKILKNRIRITDKKSNIKKKNGQLGWIDIKDIF